MNSVFLKRLLDGGGKMNKNEKIILGLFANRERAEAAISELDLLGYKVEEMSVVVKDTVINQDTGESTGSNVVEGAVGGATTGGALGGLAGLLIGIGMITLPGIGGLFIGGPLAAALGLTGAAASTVSGAATGVVAGGLLGSLVGLGVPTETAKEYENRIREGGILLAVPMRQDNQQQVEDIYAKNGASNVRTIG